MVSTRGIKLKFFIGERVLCYEPDPTKAKVLYDSKVLDIVIRKEQAGKKVVEYLIHFQGWNSSWDRCVKEEYVLKDTPENRQLQKDLAEKAQLQLGAYLYRKERKKHNQKSGDRTAGSSEEGSSGSPTQIDTDDHEMSTSSDENSSIDDESIEIDIIPELRAILEEDYYLINGKNKRVKLPAEPNVVFILESYYKHYATNQICGLQEKQNYRCRNNFYKDSKPKTEDIQKNLALCREVVDGLRIYFDFTLNDLLLYGAEKDAGQFVTATAVIQPPGSSEVKLEVKNESNSNSTENNSNNIQNSDQVNQNGVGDASSVNARRRTLRSNKNEPQTNGNSTVEETNGTNYSKPCSSVGSSNSDINGPLAKALSWRLLPEHVYSQQPPPPCLAYGAIHFTRLFVKLPELFTASSIPEAKMKIILRHVDCIIDFLNDHKDWYGEKYYEDPPSTN
ncbi:male-specific lethal 3 homolog [Sitophilus oryzae]|uniref:Protein male-specific lethal-3 n=1 Tax=Sitophilus oryzae TaxID=7048 RepID=A0A6J2XAW2_SITOR|nr:male-specific lethal 3 homolog [Sitophilus oryzae]